MNKLIEKAKKAGLTKTELQYFQMMAGQYLVPVLKGRPGTAKSAILKSIADKLDMVFIDLRLPTMDEIDLGVYPVVTQIETGGKKLDQHRLGHALPEWALMTSDKTKNFMIVFEELNRASKPVRDASLGILNERRVGFNFVFGDNVYMAATGNLGTEDGTDVEEFDTALKSRLLTVQHDMGFADWKMSWAQIEDDKGKVITQNVHPDIVAFLQDSPQYFYPDLKENEQKDVITNPRTWTALSEAIIKNFGVNATVDQYKEFVATMGKCYVGSNVVRFLKFVDNNKPVSFREIVDGKVTNYAKIKRDNKAEINRDFIEAVKSGEFDKYPKTKLDRVIEYASTLDDDVLTGLVYRNANEVLAMSGEKCKLSDNQKVWAKAFNKQIEYINANVETFENIEENDSKNAS